MRENLKTLAIIFSVVLNLVFIGSYVYHRSDQTFIARQNTPHRRLLYEKLNLNRMQLDRIEPIRDRFHAFLGQQGYSIKSKQLELIDLLSKENPGREDVDLKQKEIQNLQRQMQTKVINHLLAESRIFTPEQRTRFFALIRGRIEKSDVSRPQWMPQTQVKPSRGDD